MELKLKGDDFKVVVFSGCANLQCENEGKVQLTAVELPLFNSRGKVLLPPALHGEGCPVPAYVNPKQITRILRRREAKRRLMASGLMPRHRSRYLHESRHQHALNRSRGFRGRFERHDEIPVADSNSLKGVEANKEESSAETKSSDSRDTF